MPVAGIDPAYGKPFAYAIFDDYNVLIKTGKFNTMDEMPKELICCDKMFIEDQFFSRNPKIYKILSQYAGKIMGICEFAKIPYEMVHPKTWQAYFKIPKKDKSLSAYHWKKLHAEQIIFKARDLTNQLINDDDIACAVLIAAYGIRNK